MEAPSEPIPTARPFAALNKKGDPPITLATEEIINCSAARCESCVFSAV
jgi:hypothetical protein